MNPQFLSLGMIITGRWRDQDQPNLSAMDVLASCIADEEKSPPKIIDFLTANKDGVK